MCGIWFYGFCIKGLFFSVVQSSGFVSNQVVVIQKFRKSPIVACEASQTCG